MGNKNTTSNDILIKVDQNNLIFIDPNSVLSNGVVEQRGVEPENLVMYVNLEADLVPRTVLITGDEQNVLTSIAKGTLNILQNKNGEDYDTTWTDAYSDIKQTKEKTSKTDAIFAQYDGSAQNFGIDNISIKIAGSNFVPQVSIKFIDVRGKTMFESPENSPYKAFFHLPWPIFYLTVKGYYGKAIKYRLHMVSFSSKFNGQNGNFEIDTTFVGSTYAYLCDIPVDGILNAPYMYAIEQSPNNTFNENTGLYEKKLKKTSKGYVTLKSVYDEYKQKGLLPQNFPVKTLKEVLVIAKRLNKILENEIFSQVIDPTVLSGVKEFEDLIINFESALNEWKRRYASPVTFDDKSVSGKYWNELAGQNKNSLEFIVGTDEKTLESVIKRFTDKLKTNPAFGENRVESKILNNDLDIKTISFAGLQNIKDFYINQDSRFGVNIDGASVGSVLQRLYDVQRDFVQQSSKLIASVEKKMNDIVKRQDIGIGFEPTIRNIVGVILANADTYIRLLKDVHYNAFQQAENRKDLLKNITDSIGDAIYPWPEVKKPTAGVKQNVLVYPGNIEMVQKLHSDDAVLWPEINFVETYHGVATKKIDPLTEKEGDSELVNLVFESNSDELSKKDISTLTYLTNVVPYYDKSIASILYEVWERAKYITSVDSFNSEAIRELALIEFENISKQVDEDFDIVEVLNKVSDAKTLQDYMRGFSPYERYPYYQDQIPTVSYIKNVVEQDFKIEKFVKSTKTLNDRNKYSKLNENLRTYVSENYRTNIYPFSSSGYTVNYLNKSNFTNNELNLRGILQVNSNDAFIESLTTPVMWVKDNIDNLFTNTLKIQGLDKHILNTPYFHKQLFNDFNNSNTINKFAGSSYLLLNSLPFKDLDDYINFNGETVLMSSIFREVGSSHFIPYHLMVKWGSIYHRYKKFITEGVDIIGNVTIPINGDQFFDNFENSTYDLIAGYTANRLDQTNIGVNPFYQSEFHFVVNDYTFFDQTPSGYTNSLNNGGLKTFYKSMIGGNAWTSFVDNSKFDPTDMRYTLLPSNGYNDYDNIEDYFGSEQENYRLIWNNKRITPDRETPTYSGETFPSYNQYFKSFNNEYSLSSNNKKIIDLIGTFKPDILDVFENAFIEFATQTFEEDIPFKPYDINYSTFQSLLKEISSVKKENSDSTDIDTLIRQIQDKQYQNLIFLSNAILSNDNLIKLTIGNPKEIDNYVLGGFTNLDVTNFNTYAYEGEENLDLIELYLGEDIDLYYKRFFLTNDIKMSEENIKSFRFLIYIYAGYISAGGVDTKNDFVNYLVDNILLKDKDKNVSSSMGQIERLSNFLQILIPKFTSLKVITTNQRLNINHGYNDEIIKLELYSLFKSFNDKWISGNSIGQRTLMEEFLFLDKANRDIGDKVFIDMEKLIDIIEQKDSNKMNLYSLIGLLISNTGLDMRALPAYVNFYGTNFSNKAKVVPSKNVGKNIFGSFMEIDTQESMPKIILQYIGPVSKHLDLTEIDKKYKFKNDSFNISDINNNPIIVAPDVFRDTDFSKENKVVAFEVSVGDQNQGIFKGFDVAQDSIKNTSESFAVLERLGNANTGSSTAQVDIGLFDIYRQASYTCTVTAMGNVMIQPTMYFYLKNVPMFKGSYWITEVNHNIKSSGIETSFKGTRIPIQSLPDPKDSFLASYRALFDKITKKAIIKVQNSQLSTTNSERTIINKSTGETTVTDMGSNQTDKGVLIETSGIKGYGIPYNGYNDEKFIQLVKYNNEEWLRAVVCEMGGKYYLLENNPYMSFISYYKNSLNESKGIKWTDVQKDSSEYYSTKFIFNKINQNEIISQYPNTVFQNPKNGVSKTITNSIDIDNLKFSGPVNVGPKEGGFGISLSKQLMRDLGLYDNDVLYFRLQ